MSKFSNKSKSHLASCDVRLQEVCNLAINIMDFSIITGHRNKEDQNRAFKEGRSKLTYPNGKHNVYPSQAVDVAPYPIDWSDGERFVLLAGIIMAVAKMRGVKLRWGGDWNGNFSLKDNKFSDLGHFEIIN